MEDLLRLRMQHSSLQYSDTPRQQSSDISDLFESGTAFPIKTGTEAGIDPKHKNANRELLQHFADKFDHRIHFVRDVWVAVDKQIVKNGTRTNPDGRILSDNKIATGIGGDRALASLSFDHAIEGVGYISVGCVHTLTKGRKHGDPNYHINKANAATVANWMHDAGRGRALAFCNGDWNSPDNKYDWAFGGAFTSMADELKDWQNTGHGPIDGFTSFDGDGRVKALRFTVLDDKEFHQFSDHFVCRGTWGIKLTQH